MTGPNTRYVLKIGRHGRFGWHGRPWRQGLTLVHLSAQRKRFLWDKGCISGWFRGRVGGVNGW